MSREPLGTLPPTREMIECPCGGSRGFVPFSCLRCRVTVPRGIENARRHFPYGQNIRTPARLASGFISELEQRIAILRGHLPLANDQPVTVGTGLVRDLLDEIARLKTAFWGQVEHTDIVRAEYLKRLDAERTARLAAEGERDYWKLTSDANATGDVDKLRAALAGVRAKLLEIERHCPCGARPESPFTHPHVGGCRVAEAIMLVALAPQEPPARPETNVEVQRILDADRCPRSWQDFWRLLHDRWGSDRESPEYNKTAWRLMQTWLERIERGAT